jgi:hypothetical protein
LSRAPACRKRRRRHDHGRRDEDRTECRNKATTAAAYADRKHATPQRRKRHPSPRPLAVSHRASPRQRPSNDRTPRLRQDTPPDALARDRCWWQISWLAGRCIRPPSQDHDCSQWQYRSEAHRLQLRGQPRRCARNNVHAPRSLLIPFGNHRHQPWRYSGNRSSAF